MAQIAGLSVMSVGVVSGARTMKVVVTLLRLLMRWSPGQYALLE